MVLERNWLDVYPYTNWGGNSNLPALAQGQAFMPSDLTLRTVGTQGRGGGRGGQWGLHLPA